MLLVWLLARKEEAIEQKDQIIAGLKEELATVRAKTIEECARIADAYAKGRPRLQRMILQFTNEILVILIAQLMLGIMILL